MRDGLVAPGSTPMAEAPALDKDERVAALEQVLEAARHALVTLHGLYATDRADLAAAVHDSLMWQIDTAAVVAQLDAALEPRKGTEACR